MAEYVKTALRGLIIPSGSEVVTTDSGLFLAGSRVSALPDAEVRPGAPVPATTSQQGILESYKGDGAWTPQDLSVVVARGGHPDRQGAAIYVQSGSTLYGWEAPSVLTSSRYLSASGLSDVAICAHPDGLVVAGEAGGTYLRMLQIAGDGNSILNTTNLNDQATVLTARTQPYSPALVYLPTGRIVCIFFGEESTGYWTLRSVYSDDRGATWNLLSPRLHPTAYDPAATLPRRIRAAYSQDQILICVEYVVGFANAIAQFVSYDNGATATLIAGLTGTTAGLALGGGHDVAAIPGGGFVLVYVSQSNQYPYSYRIAAAEEPFAYASTNVQVVAAGTKWGYLTAGYLDKDLDLILVSAEDGTLYLTARLAAGTDSWVSLRSLDTGDTWEKMGDTSGLQAGAWHKTGVAGSGPWIAAGCWWKGSLWLAHNSQSAVGGAGADRLWLSRLGGWRSLTLPALSSAGDEADQVTWELTWLPMDKPQDSGWTRAAVGAPTDTISSGALLVTTAGGESLRYTAVPGGASTALVAEAVVEVLSGSADLRAALDNGVYTREVIVRITRSIPTPSLITITAGDVSGGTLGSTTITSTDRVGLRIHMLGSDCAVWYTLDGKTWVNLCETAALANGGGTIGTNRVRWGCGASSSANWYEVPFTSGSYAGLVNLADPPDQIGIATSGLITVRNGLHPRPASSSPASGWDGLALALRSGPVAAGESWSITSTSPYSSSNILPVNRPSPQSIARWVDLGTSADQIRLVVSLDPATVPPGVLVGCYLAGLYGGPWTIGLWDGAAWTDMATTPVYTFTARIDVVGNYFSLRPQSSAGVSVRWSELVGAAVRVWTDNTKVTLVSSGKVVSNSEGIISAYVASARTARIVVEGVTASAGTTRYIEVFPREAIVVLDSYLRSSTLLPSKVRLTTPVGTLYYGSKWGEMAVCAVGPCAIFGKDYSLTRNLAIEPGGKLLDLPGGVRLADNATPARRAVELSWVEGVDLYDIRRVNTTTSHTPDYVRWGSASPPVAARHDTALLVADLIEWGNGTRLVVYLPTVPVSDSGQWAASVDRARGALYGRMVGAARLEQAVGEEEVSDLVRVSTVTIEEEL